MQPDLNQMMRSLGKAQEELFKAQEQLAKTEVEGSAGGGAVKVSCTGAFVFKSIKIQPDAVDTSDLGMLEDLILTAVNDATSKAQELGQKQMAQSMKGVNLPPGLRF